MKKCCFIIPYFGKLPNYFQLFLKTCSYNQDFNWLLITDNKKTFIYPSNFKVIHMEFDALRLLIQSKFDFPISLTTPYKLCDYKPAYGYIFEEYIKNYLMWGYCDIDILVGQLNRFITDEMMQDYVKIFCLGHMALYKNTPQNNSIFKSEYKGELLYKKVFSTDSICWFDEEWKDTYNINQIFLTQGKKVFREDLSLNISVLPTKFVRTIYEGINVCPLTHGYRKEKYIYAIYIWTEGHLYRFYKNNKNDLIKEEYPYIHLQRRKMRYKEDLYKEKTIKIIPNCFEKLEYPTVNNDNFLYIRNHSFCTHYFYIKIKPKLLKIKRIFFSTIK